MKLIRLSFYALVALVGIGIWSATAVAGECIYLSDEFGFVCDAEPEPAVFVEPEPVANSILPNMTYGRQEDNANVYAEPSMGAPIVRNVGDGFLYATIMATIQNEEGLWHMINYGEFMRAEDIRVVDDSDFTGFQVNDTPERPFAWMIVDYWASDEPGGEPAGPKLPRYTFFEIMDAEKDDEGWIWYDMGNGRWMRQTYVSIVEPKPRPAEVGEDEYWVEVDLYEQSFAAYEGDRMVYAGLISSGLNRWPTNEGLFQVWSRHLSTKMSGAEGRVDYYYIEDVPHTLFFDNDIALHGAFWHDRFGYKHSHGCVNMPPRAAEWIFFWSEEAPNDLWVWVHSSDPDAIFDRIDTQQPFAGP